MDYRILCFVLCAPLVVYCQTLIPVITGPRPYPKTSVPPISNAEMDTAFRAAELEVAARLEDEKRLVATGGIIPPTSHSAEARHQRFVKEFGQARKMDQIEELFEGATRNLTRIKRLTPDQVRFGLPEVPLTSPKARAAVAECKKMYQISCSNSKYRTADGSCNNLNHPEWGKSFTCFQRLLPAAYDDGISIPRKSVADNGPLPNARIISTTVHNDVNIESVQYTHMVMQFGQFLDHDFSLTPMTRTSNDGMIECCPENTFSHPECFPIAIPNNDAFFSQFRQTCLNFVRSASCTRCYLGPRDQTDQLTAFIDGSQVYGSVVEDTKLLRTFTDGLLRFTQAGTEKELLPPSNDTANDQCSDVSQNQICFLAGDTRVNEQPGLTAMHTIWLRQHNRIARELKFHNPRWSDEILFQETRRIVGAQIQMVAYGEFLPVVLGPQYMDYFKLQVSPQLKNGGRTSYDADTEPTILHEFGTAAYRFGHTLIRNLFGLGPRGSLRLRDFFFFPFGIRTGDTNYLMYGLTRDPAMQYDRHIVEAVSNCVYCTREAGFGMDLPALNLQRGRDHGLNSYVSYLNYCFNLNVRSFNDLSRVMNADAIKRLQLVYKSVFDIDLFSGGVSETSLPGGVVGPTFGCIIGLQFFHLKYGDRYYFEHANQIGSFTNDQLYEIKYTTLARIVCANSNLPTNTIQPNAFLPPNPNGNPVLACPNIVDLDLTPWRQ